MTRKKEKINLVEPAETNFILNLSERLRYLKSYFDDVYKPLKANFSVSKLEERPYILVRFVLNGKNYWSVGTELNVSEHMHLALDSSHLVQKYTDEIKKGIEEAVRQEGIKSINQ